MPKAGRGRHVLNGIGHFDISGPDIEQLGQFYAATFGWTVHARGPGYSSLETPDGAVDGAIVESDDAALTVGIVVPQLDAALNAAVEHGGTVIMPVTDNGWVKKAQIRDPAGNCLTLIAG
jgi:predicted enzyme related to lactoylglutathione lyase